jgi:branched-chain amino acid transport system substrate-binding protein
MSAGQWGSGGTQWVGNTAAPILSRRSVLSVGVLAAAAAALAACSTSGDTAAGPPGPDLVIGANLELSGQYASLGDAQWDALNIAVDTINDSGFMVNGRPTTVRLIPAVDNQGDPKQAASGMRSLTSTAGIAGVVGGLTAATAIAMAPIARQHRVPMLSLSTDPGVVGAAGAGQTVFLLGPRPVDVAARLLTTAARLHCTTIGVIAGSDAYGSQGRDAIAQAIKDVRGLRLLKLSGDDAANLLVNPGGTTPEAFASAAHTIAERNPDAVVIWGFGLIGPLVARQLRAEQYSGLLLFDTAAATDDTITGANAAAASGAYVVGPGILITPSLPATTPIDAQRQSFYNAYRLQHPGFSSLAAFGADGVNVLAQAAFVARSVEAAHVEAALARLSYDGLAGSYAFAKGTDGALTADSLDVFLVDQTGWDLQATD